VTPQDPGSLANDTVVRRDNHRQQQVRTAQIRLLYANAHTGIAVTFIAAPIVYYCQRRAVPPPLLLGWLLCMLVVAVARLILVRRFWAISPTDAISRWSYAFAAGAGVAGVGWGAAAFLPNSDALLLNQLFVVFVLGGMMLGGASLLAARPEAFVAFLVPTGLLPAVRFLATGDQQHAAMGLLAAVFTLATLTTTWRLFRTIESSLTVKFENSELVEKLQRANHQTEALNQQLERRVADRTAELQESTERLRTEIHQREEMEEALLRARKLESLGVLAGGIAHDFNNFLTVVQVNIELARLRLDPAAPVQVILEQTAKACESAVFLSSQLLTFAKGGAPIRRSMPMATLITDAVHLARAGAPVTISVDIADDLWSAEVDVGQISQVFHNILLNAKQAMPSGGVIEVRAENVRLRGDTEHVSGAHVRVSISDYGPGISADILPRIFDPYFTTRPSGSGLGLATAYAIVTKHGGRLSVESTAGKGTVFVVDLPAVSTSSDRDAAQVPSPSESHPEPRHSSRTARLLVMDDQETLRLLLTSVLTTLGYEVMSARDGAEAIDLYEAAMASGRGFDAVMLDLTVSGGMGGLEAAQKLRELQPSVRLVASSGYSDAPVMARFRDYGFADVLPKPWTLAQLSAVCRRVLTPDSQNTSKELP
jgi:signal transduction histidine kinase/ActR/RegA family two-component response regulator